LQYLTASELVPPSSIISATHLLKSLDSFFTEQNPKAIAAKAIAETKLEPSCTTP